VVKDFHAGYTRRTVRVPKELGYLRDYYPVKDHSPFSLFSVYYRFGASLDEIAASVARENPDLVGISSLFSTYHEEAFAAARKIKEWKDVPIVMGGSHPSALPEVALRHPSVDFIVRGEGERPLVELIEALRRDSDLKAVPNLGFKLKGRCVLNGVEPNYPIEDLPIPDMSDLNPALYTSQRKAVVALVSSRGCPYGCDFCSVRTTFGNAYRRRSNQSILDEMGLRYAAGCRVFDFEDDNFAFDHRQTISLLEQIIDRFPHGSLELFAMNGLCYFGLDSELLHLMKRAGFSQLNLSLVSGNPQVCADHCRPSRVDSFEKVVREAVRLGMRVIGYQILGLPGESLDSMVRTLAFLAQLPLLIGASVFYLAPGSPLWEKEHGREDQLSQARLTALPTHSEFVSRDDLYTLLATARIINYVKSLDLSDAQQGEMSLDQALDGTPDARSKLGARLLRTLLSEGRLFAWDGRRDHPLDRFRPAVFERVWSEIGVIRTVRGGTVVT